MIKNRSDVDKDSANFRASYDDMINIQDQNMEINDENLQNSAYKLSVKKIKRETDASFYNAGLTTSMDNGLPASHQ